MTVNPRQSLTELRFERDWLVAQINQGRVEEESDAQEKIMERLDQIDLALAATPAVSISDLIIKLSRLACLVCPTRAPIPETTIEGVFLRAIMADAIALAAREEMGR